MIPFENTPEYLTGLAADRNMRDLLNKLMSPVPNYLRARQLIVEASEKLNQAMAEIYFFWEDMQAVTANPPPVPPSIIVPMQYQVKDKRKRLGN